MWKMFKKLNHFFLLIIIIKDLHKYYFKMVYEIYIF